MVAVPTRRLAEAGTRELSTEEAREAFERAARHYLGMSGEEFVRAWEAGAFGPDPDAIPGVMEVAMIRAWAAR